MRKPIQHGFLIQALLFVAYLLAGFITMASVIAPLILSWHFDNQWWLLLWILFPIALYADAYIVYLIDKTPERSEK